MRSSRVVTLLVATAGAAALAVPGAAASPPAAGPPARVAPETTAADTGADRGVAALAAELARLGGAGFVVSRDPVTRTIEVELSDTTKDSVGVRLQSSARALGETVTLRSLAGSPSTAACSGDFCDRPLRAGVSILSSGGTCSSAFTARSRTDNRWYLMTAGHCGSVGTAFSTRFADGSSHAIGPVHNRRFGSAGDYSIIRVNNQPGWTPRGWVFVRGGSSTTRNETYPIRAVGTSRVGMRICKSGGTTNTTCGTVDRLGVSVNYGGVTVNGLGEADLCVRPGDSGGAVFASNTAYGIVSGYVPDTCRSFYQGVAGAASALNVRIAFN